MLEYRRKDLDLSTRTAIGVEMLSSAEVRGWGRASELAKEYETPLQKGHLYPPQNNKSLIQ